MTGRNIDALAAKASAEIERQIAREPQGVGARGVEERWRAVYPVGERSESDLKGLVRGRGS